MQTATVTGALTGPPARLRPPCRRRRYAVSSSRRASLASLDLAADVRVDRPIRPIDHEQVLFPDMDAVMTAWAAVGSGSEVAAALRHRQPPVSFARSKPPQGGGRQAVRRWCARPDSNQHGLAAFAF